MGPGVLVGSVIRTGTGVAVGVAARTGATVCPGSTEGASAPVGVGVSSASPTVGSGVNVASITTNRGRRVGFTPGTGTAVDRGGVGVLGAAVARLPDGGTTKRPVPGGVTLAKILCPGGPESEQAIASPSRVRIMTANGYPRLVLKGLLQGLMRG